MVCTTIGFFPKFTMNVQNYVTKAGLYTTINRCDFSPCMSSGIHHAPILHIYFRLYSVKGRNQLYLLAVCKHISTPKNYSFKTAVFSIVSKTIVYSNYSF